VALFPELPTEEMVKRNICDLAGAPRRGRKAALKR